MNAFPHGRQPILTLLPMAVLLASLPLPLASSPMQLEVDSTSYESVCQLAETLAGQEYQAHVPDPKSLVEQLDYDGYRALSFREDKTVWKDEGSLFRLQFFHLGHLFHKPVKMNLIEDETVCGLTCSSEWFDYSRSHLDFTSYDVDGFAGFRILSPLVNQNARWDEVGSFLGASYFRLLGENQSYGLSARGLAIDTAHPENAEEFPDFVEHWVSRPAPCDESVRIYSLLDGPSVAGAYSFEIHPGKTTTADVEVTLYFRKEVDRLGLAPLTSMHWIGKNSERLFQEYRPEVHDSDGMLLHLASGEKLWRPLVNHDHLRTSVFQANSPKGFGLMQRERSFEQYQDLWNAYHRTPSLYIEPLNDWGPGRVWLFEFPTSREIDDNIVLSWEPETNPKAGDKLHLKYRMHWLKAEENEFSPNRVTATRVGAGQDFGKNALQAMQERLFAVEFSGPDLDWEGELPSGEDHPEPVLTSTPDGRINGAFCVPNPHNKSWRVVFRLHIGCSTEQVPIELRCFLKRRDKVVSETWSYLWSP